MPKILVLKGPMKGRTFEIEKDTTFLGRSVKNDIQVKDSAVSRKQLKIFRIGNKFFIEDLKSTNGTLLNGEMIASGEGFEVGEKDTFSIGHTVMRLSGVQGPRPLDLAAHSTGTGSGEKDRGTEERRFSTGKNLELIYKVSELLKQSFSINEFLEKVLEYVIESLPRIDRAAILLFDSQKEQIGEVIYGPGKDTGKSGFQYSRTVVNQVIGNQKAIRMSNTTYEEPGSLSDSMATLQLGSVMCVPMISNSQMRGVIYVDSFRTPYGFRKEDLLLLNTLSGPVAVAIEKAKPDS